MNSKYPGPSSRPSSVLPSDAEQELKRELLRVILSKTLKKNGIPPQWISVEMNAMTQPSGEVWIEINFSLQIDEPRFLTYISSFQAEFERRLLEIAPDAREWLSRMAWTVTPDPIYEAALPSPGYWETVMADRELTARQKGAMGWDRESLARHFSDTNPGDMVVDFKNTQPPDRNIENLAPPKR